LFRLAIRRPDIVHDDMDDELRFHLDERVEHFVSRGMSRDAARAEAMRRLGGNLNETRARLHRSADQRERTMAMRQRYEDLVQDLRYAARGLVRRPGFTIVAVLTLAIGIGANTAIFSAVNALMFRPLPFREPDRLMQAYFTVDAYNGRPAARSVVWSWLKYLTFRDIQGQFQSHALWVQGNFSLTGENAERISGEWTSARYLSTLGVAPAMGRTFDADGDETYDAPKIVILSDDLWKRRFNADPDILRKAIPIEGTAYRVVGVMPAGFRGLSGEAELFVPITTRTTATIGPGQAWSHEFQLIARLRPGVSAEQAAAAAPQWAAAIAAAYPDQGGHGPTWGVRVEPLDAGRVSPAVRESMLVLLAAVGFVLLIACVNLASLMLGRAAARRSEIAIRLALGARRGRLIRLLLVESMLLAVLGGAASIAVALAGINALAVSNPAETLRVQNLSGLGVASFSSIRLDTTALLFTAATSVIVAILFGLAPALQATRDDVTNDIKAGAVAARGSGGRRSRTRQVLVVAEVAIAVVLLAGSGLMIRSLANLLRVDPGFSSDGILTMRLTMPDAAVPRDSLPGFYDRLTSELMALPGVNGVGLADSPPLGGGSSRTIMTFPEHPEIPFTQLPIVGVHWVTPEWFSVMRIPVLRGRLPGPADGPNAPKVIAISQSAARKFWPNEDPIGKRAGIGQGGFNDGATIVAVVGDVRYRSVDSLPGPDVYLPYAQSARPRMMIFVRTAQDAMSLVPSVRRVVSGLVPGIPVFDIASMATRTAVATAQTRFSAMVLAMFATTALLLAVIGIYGVMSLVVSQRTREIGIRMALGADRSRVRGLVVREGLVLAAAGAAIGIVAALALTRVLRSMLYDVHPADPVTYAAIVVLLAAAAAIASWLPARRASQVEPTEALRAG